MTGELILIVDATPINMKLTRMLLVNDGYQVLTAATAEQAMELLHSYHPRLMLVAGQPGVDWLNLTRHVKHDPGTRDIQVIVSTASPTTDEQEALHAGC